MSTYISWGLFLGAVGAAGVYYYTSDGQRKRGRGWKPFTPAQAKRREVSRQRRDSREQRRKEAEGYGSDPAAGPSQDKQLESGTANGDAKLKNRKGKKQQSSKLAQDDTRPEPQGQDNEEDHDDLDFAKQLQDKRNGTSLKQSDQPQKKKAKRQAKRAQAAAAAQNVGGPNGSGNAQQETSTASSTTGADADDDMSSSTSLDLGPAPAAGDVSDMLEAPAKGPSVLNITETPKAPRSQPKSQKPAQQPESKKARQNRQRREAEKAANEEAEVERRKLLENQRRTAREARGEPAKNGLGTSQQTAKNAWTGVGKAGGNADTLAKVPAPSMPQGQSHQPLLDTFDEPAPSRANKSAHTNGAGTDYSSLPSEEEQMKLLSEMDGEVNGWATVPSKGTKKPKAQKQESQLQTSQSNSSIRDEKTGDAASLFPKGAPGTVFNAEANGLVAPATGAQKPQKKKSANRLVNGEKKAGEDGGTWHSGNIKEHPDYDPNFPYALVGHPLDSDWRI